MAEVVEATKTHAVILAPRLRREDVEEIKAMNDIELKILRGNKNFKK